MSVKVTDKGYARILRETRRLDKIAVEVGIQSNAGSGDDGVAIVDKAFWNEYGTERIPERSFLRAAYDENKADLDDVIYRLWGGVIDGKFGAMKAAQVLGQRHEDQVKTKINNGPFEPNAASTIARKGSSKPLVDTREMLNSIRYEVKR